MTLKDVLTALAWPAAIFAVVGLVLTLMSFAHASGDNLEDINPSPACVAMGVDAMAIMQYKDGGVKIEDLKNAMDHAEIGTDADKALAKTMADWGYAYKGGDNVDFAIVVIKKCVSGEIQPWSFLQEEQPVEQPDDGKHI